MNQTQLFDLLDKYFHWLIDDFGLSYKRNEFASVYSSDKLAMELCWDRYHPTIDIILHGEPDYSRLSFGWVISYLTNERFNANNSFYKSGDKEENAKKLAELFKTHSKHIILEIDTWWIPAQKNKIKIWENDLGISPVNFLDRIYKYVESFERAD